MSIADWIYRQATTDRIAFEFEGDAISYATLARRIDDTARGLVESGVRVGDRVGFCGLNRIELFEVLFACARLGAIFVPYNNRLTAAELAVQIPNSDPSLLLTTDGFDSLLSQAAPDLPVRDLDTSPFLSTDIALNDAALADAALPDDHDEPRSTVVMVYTSGTTGHAKGAMLSHRSIVHTVRNGIDQQELTAADCVVAPLPTFHVGGLTIQTLPTLSVGGRVLLQRRFDPAGVVELIEKHRATQTLLVPAMLSAVSALPSFAEADLSSLRGINSGSSVVPAHVMAPYFERGIPVGQVYGTTETGPTAVVLGYAEAADHVGSCGQPASYTELRVVEADGVDVTAGSPGEIWLRGANLFTGYWRDAQATEAAFVDGWFRTGDVGYRDAAGYLFISDRITDVVISGGENVYPAEVEPILLQHPGIADVAVIGMPDDQWGEVPVAVIVAAPEGAPSLEELRSWCEGRLARFKQPGAVRVVDVLPRTALGKVKKHELRD